MKYEHVPEVFLIFYLIKKYFMTHVLHLQPPSQPTFICSLLNNRKLPYNLLLINNDLQ